MSYDGGQTWQDAVEFEPRVYHMSPGEPPQWTVEEFGGVLQVSFDHGVRWHTMPPGDSLEERVGQVWAGLGRQGAREIVDARAESLLLDHLDEHQAASWRAHGFFVVAGASGTRYEVHPDTVKDPSGSWCLMPTRHNVPVADIVLARKLWLEADERGFLRAANFFPRNGNVRVYGAPVELGRRQLEEHLADARREHQDRVEELHRDFQERLADEERRYREEVEGIHLEYHRQRIVEVPQARADIVFRANEDDFLRLNTLEQARAWLEMHDWGAYEVNAILTDEWTVRLLEIAMQSRPRLAGDA